MAYELSLAPYLWDPEMEGTKEMTPLFVYVMPYFRSPVKNFSRYSIKKPKILLRASNRCAVRHHDQNWSVPLLQKCAESNEKWVSSMIFLKKSEHKLDVMRHRALS